jgi:hypothetical protein
VKAKGNTTNFLIFMFLELKGIYAVNEITGINSNTNNKVFIIDWLFYNPSTNIKFIRYEQEFIE